jgi:hypothetical protein
MKAAAAAAAVVAALPYPWDLSPWETSYPPTNQPSHPDSKEKTVAAQFTVQCLPLGWIPSQTLHRPKVAPTSSSLVNEALIVLQSEQLARTHAQQALTSHGGAAPWAAAVSDAVRQPTSRHAIAPAPVVMKGQDGSWC